MANDIAVRFDANIKPLVSGIDAAKLRIRDFSRDFGKGLSSALPAVGAAAAGFAVASAINRTTSAIWNQVSAVSELSNASQRLGIDFNSMTIISRAARKADVDLAQVEASVKTLMASLSDAQINRGKAGLFAQLGIDAKGAFGRSTADTLSRVAEGLSHIENQSTRVAIATDLFGKAGLGMLQMLQDGGAGLRKAAIDAERFGLTLTPEGVARITAMDDAIKDLSASFDGLWRTALGSVAPAMTSAFKSIADGIARVTNSSAWIAWEEFILTLINFVAPGATLIEQKTEPIAKQAAAIKDLSEAMSAASNTISTSAFDAAAKIWDETTTPMERFEQRFQRINDLFADGLLSQDRFGRAMTQLFDEIDKPAKAAMEQLQRKAEETIQSVETPAEKFAVGLSDLTNLLSRGLIDQDVFDRAKKNLLDEVSPIENISESFAARNAGAFTRGSSAAESVLAAARTGSTNGINKVATNTQRANVLLQQIAQKQLKVEIETVGAN